ncbi:hypothetical protein [Novosphingobium terrae]|uniref:hypothetical protein n=1 Tax=Novosphingobium terrae TaxID=2726189 RepID=UPI00198190C8|nr:hypothetical protein [Novosphingobium terrae]
MIPLLDPPINTPIRTNREQRFSGYAPIYLKRALWALVVNGTIADRLGNFPDNLGLIAGLRSGKGFRNKRGSLESVIPALMFAYHLS